MKKIPIKAARETAEKYDATIVVIVAWDGRTGAQHVTTYGKSKQECDWAADLGNQIKSKVLRWPDELCHTKPKRTDKPNNPYSEYTCETCGQSRNGYENHCCPPSRPEPCGDEEERFCETCGARMIVPAKSGATECSRCLE